MRSKASFRGHPIHPALIPFPVAFLGGALGFDLAGRQTDHAAWWTTGAHLAAAGVVMALIAAVPGFIDYMTTVPPNSSAKRRATKHMAVNLTAVTLFATAWVIRYPTMAMPGPAVLGLEALGFGFLVAGGWMGGVLVSRNQISVDHRYAGAGKWREQTLHKDANGAVFVQIDDLARDQMMLLRVNDQRIVLARTEDGFAAFDDHCMHRGGSLADGVLICGTVQCPWHGSQFDVSTGAPKAGPADRAI